MLSVTDIHNQYQILHPIIVKSIKQWSKWLSSLYSISQVVIYIITNIFAAAKLRHWSFHKDILCLFNYQDKIKINEKKRRRGKWNNSQILTRITCTREPAAEAWIIQWKAWWLLAPNFSLRLRTCTWKFTGRGGDYKLHTKNYLPRSRGVFHTLREVINKKNKKSMYFV